MDANTAGILAMLLAMPVAFAIDPFAPPLVLGLCLRFHLIHEPALLGPAFAGFAGWPFIGVSAALYAAHALADKIPPIAHVMDVIGLAVKPLVVGFVGLWVSRQINVGPNLHWLVLAAIFAGGVPAAAALQAFRAKARGAASLVSLGAALPVISGAENVAGLGLTSLILTHPLIALTAILVVGVPIAWLTWTIISRATKGARSLVAAGRSALSKGQSTMGSDGVI